MIIVTRPGQLLRGCPATPACDRYAMKILFRVVVVSLLIAGVGCGGNAPDYFPVSPGKYWQYAVTVTNMDVVKSGKTILMSEPAQQHGPYRLYPREVNQQSRLYYVKDEHGVYLYQERGVRGIQRCWKGRFSCPRSELEQVAADMADTDKAKTPFLNPVMLLPLKVGAHWQRQSTTGALEIVVDPFRRLLRIEVPVSLDFVVESMDDAVSVKAGDFTHCLRIRGTGKGFFNSDKTLGKAHISVEQTDWYAPGVGLVKTIREEKTDNQILSHGEYVEELELFRD